MPGNSIFNTIALNPSNGRFEGFKSLGKIGNIESEELQNDIMDLYQENITSLLASTERYGLFCAQTLYRIHHRHFYSLEADQHCGE